MATSIELLDEDKADEGNLQLNGNVIGRWKKIPYASYFIEITTPIVASFTGTREDAISAIERAIDEALAIDEASVIEVHDDGSAPTTKKIGSKFGK
ncbi:MAG: hypothetical protein ACRYHA_07630 [Janthinobacterium lividum]